MSRTTGNPTDHLPLTPPVFQILLALGAGERHGYGIMQDVSDQTNTQVMMGPGTLYGCLKRMLRSGLIRESMARPDPRYDDERRRYYRLTRLGRDVAAAEARRLQNLVRSAQARGFLPQSGTA